MFKNLSTKLVKLTNKQRAIVILVAVLVIAGALAGCSFGKRGSTPATEVPLDQPSQEVVEQLAEEEEPEEEQLDDPEQGSVGEEIADEGGAAEVIGGETSGDSVAVPETEETKEKESALDKFFGNVFTKKYTVKFETGEGAEMKNKRVSSGTAISKLDTPYWAEHIFLGWFYDAELTQPVLSTDRVTKNLTLYASYLEQTPLETLETVNFASAVDVDSGFAIDVVTTDLELTAVDVLAAITAEDITDPNLETAEIIRVRGSNGEFTISGNGGFREGASYRITLNNDELRFKDQPESAREYNFTVYREEIQNLTMQDDIKYVPMNKIKDIVNNGESVSTLNFSLFESEGSKVAPADLAEGSFTYKGDVAINVGDVICVYEGEIPTNRTKDTPKDKLGDLAYLEITDVNGTSYSYKNADAEDVLFTPDVLPMPESAEDLDNNPETLTVENKYLDYSDDFYSYLNLDSQTTVDKGDFLAFYEGEHGRFGEDDDARLTGYGKITKVMENENGTTTITFEEVEWEDVESSMALYAKQEMTAEEMLEGVDIEAMESEIEQQAIDSGFAEEAATYLASLALATENFTALSENMDLEDYKVTLTDGSPVSPEELQLMSGGSVGVSVDKLDVRAKVSKKPTHLGNIAGTSADEKGLCISLDVMVVLTIDSADEQGELEITITGSFVEEVGVDFSASGDAIWDWAFIIPYISEYKATANVDVINYTGVSFNATMVTKEKGSKIDALDMANEIKQLLQSMTNKADEGNKLQDSLVQRYSDLVNTETDWIKVVDKNIFEAKINVPFGIPLIRIGFSMDFVVQMDAAISIGFDFEYLEGKRYSFTVEVFAQNAYSNTINLQEKTYQFCFYTMGRLGIKAGLELEFSISLISDSVAALGVEAGAGAYTNLWGYFFYELRYSDSQGKNQQYSGALLMEVGVYAEACLKAEAAGGKYSARLVLFDDEWKLYEAGRRDNVLDFDTDQKDMPEIVMKQYVRRFQLPDSIFNMDYLDLVTGELKNAVYDDSSDYVITMTNNKFSYSPYGNTISVNPDEEDIKLEGEMIITWKKQPMSFTSKPMQRTISLYWDNLRSGYMIVPYTNGGSFVPMIVKNFEQRVKQPADPERLGYTFAGWYRDEALTSPYEFPKLMPNTDTNIYAKWTPNTDTPYTVEHYQENFRSGKYELYETDAYKGTTDAVVIPAVKNYTGFVSPAAQQLQILPDGSAVLRYYYDLERHTVTFDSGKIDGVEVTAEEDVIYTLKYGAAVSAPQMAIKGYTFAGWTTDGSTEAEIAETIGSGDLVYTAKWEKNHDTEYRVEYYVQQTDGRYVLQHMFKDEAETGQTLTANYLRALPVEGTTSADEKYLLDDAIEFENITVKGIACEDGIATVDGTGKTVIKVNYKRLQHNLTFDLGYEGSQPIARDVFYDAEVVAPMNVTRLGYTFAGWNTTPVTIMPAHSLIYTAQWVPNTYTVKFDKGVESAVGTMADMLFTYDQAQNLTANGFARAGYTFAGWMLDRTLYADGASALNLAAEEGAVVTLKADWTPVIYDITYETQDGVHNNPATYTVEDAIVLSAPAKTGYTFEGWFDNQDFTGTAITEIPVGSLGAKTFYAKFSPNTDTAYKAEHWLEQLDGSFVLAATDNYNGTTDTKATPDVKEYDGFATPVAEEITIAADGSATVVYQYTRNTYTITLDPNHGDLNDDELTITARYEEAIEIPIPVRDGYGFNGWYNGEERFSASTMPCNNITLVAKWKEGEFGFTVNHYKQNVDGNGYTLFETYADTALMDRQVSPNPKNYEGFEKPEEQTLTIGSISAANVVDYYYARNQYELKWNLGEGATAEESYTEGEVYYGAAITVPVPQKYGYSYTWDSEPVATMPANDLSYTAQWTANEHTVCFDLGGGSVVSGLADNRQVAFDAAFGELPVMEKLGYTFKGWSADHEGNAMVLAETVLEVDSDITLYARYTLNTYNITYHNATEDEVAEFAGQYTVEEAVALANLVRIGYTFNGWFDNAEFSGLAITGIAKGTTSGDKNFYAKWTEKSYSVTFVANNGTTETATKNLLYTNELGQPDFTYAGYAFDGWSDGINTYSADTKVSELVDEVNTSLTLTALWKLQKYTITYVNVDSDDHSNEVEFTVNDSVSLGAPESRTGYRFLGWYDNSSFEGNPVEIITAGSVGDKIFYANWLEEKYVVTFHLNDATGTQYPNDPVAYTGNLPTNPFQRDGYSFVGWAISEDGEAVYTDGEAISEIIEHANDSNRIDLYAVWEVINYTITYHNPLGTGSAATTTDTYTVQKAKNLKTLSKDGGYIFGGWYENADCSGTAVKFIAEGSVGDRTYYAKWEHGGEFSIAYTKNYTDAQGNNKAVYTITRTLPANTVGSEAVQTVYVRTQNGTAYATSAEVATATGQDKYHFIHNAVAIDFYSDTDTATFEVIENDDKMTDHIPSSYQIGDKARFYFVEIGRIVSAQGKTAGTIKENAGRVTRTMPVSKYKLEKEAMYGPVEYTVVDANTEKTVYAVGFNANTHYTYNLSNVLNSKISAERKAYLEECVNWYGFGLDWSMKEVENGYQWAFLGKGKTISDTDENRLWKNALESNGRSLLDWTRVGFPLATDLVTMGNGKVTVYSYNEKSTEYVTDYGFFLELHKSDLGDVTFGFNAEFDNTDIWNGQDGTWKYKDLEMSIIPIDNYGPSRMEIAPIAITDYKKGDEIMLTMVFDEPLNSVSSDPKHQFIYKKGISTTYYSRLYKEGYFVEDAVCISAEPGTNTVVFKAKLNKDVSADWVQNKLNVWLVGLSGDNIGYTTMTVKDICDESSSYKPR